MLMRDVDLVNEELLELLADLKNDIEILITNHSDILLSDLDKRIHYNSPQGRIERNKRDKYKSSPHHDLLPRWCNDIGNFYDPVGREYLDYMINISENKIAKYDASEYCGWPNKEIFLSLVDITSNQKVKEITPDLREKSDKITYGWLNGNSRALFGLYPPGGYIPWHNNGNAPGFNILMHYSWGGKGNFYSLHEGEIITYPDKDNEWIARAGRFESTGADMVGGGVPEVAQKDASWHSASTNNWRLTVSTIINSKEVWEDVIDEMESVDL